MLLKPGLTVFDLFIDIAAPPPLSLSLHFSVGVEQ